MDASVVTSTTKITEPTEDYLEIYERIFPQAEKLNHCRLNRAKLANEASDLVLIPISKEVSPRMVVTECEKRFPVCTRIKQAHNRVLYDERCRRTIGSYYVLVKNTPIADPINEEVSALRHGQKLNQTATLMERLVHGLLFFEATGEHLDTEINQTLCAGSKNQAGLIPAVGWEKGVLCLEYYPREYALPGLRARNVQMYKP